MIPDSPKIARTGMVGSRTKGRWEAMGPEIVWLLRHVWPNDTPDLTEINLSDVDDDEARRLVNQVKDVRGAFERFVAEELVPRIPRNPTRSGVVKSLRLFRSGHSMNTDYLLLVSGLVGGDGGVLDLIAERYTISAAEKLGRFSELETLTLRESDE
jgi:hypothetical protein